MFAGTLTSCILDIEYHLLLKTGSLDNANREFSLAEPSWYMTHYTMIYKNGERMRDFLGPSFLYFGGVFNQTIIPLALVGYEMIIANSALRASLAIYHLISNARLWNNC